MNKKILSLLLTLNVTSMKPYDNAFKVKKDIKKRP
jgi:hypothetical protein